MIKAYLAGVESLYEGENIEVRYSIYEDQALLCNESIVMEYKKPAIVGQIALITLLRKLKKYMGKEIVIIINDAALYEIVRGTSTTKNNDVLKMAVQTRKEFNMFRNIDIKDISKDKAELVEWQKVLWS
ncbi:MAG TPA: hypothetical protein VEB00_02000 [Clostridia bacterium]|nr:hypothetical protein [Clostridia bacterium]